MATPPRGQMVGRANHSEPPCVTAAQWRLWTHHSVFLFPWPSLASQPPACLERAKIDMVSRNLHACGDAMCCIYSHVSALYVLLLCSTTPYGPTHLRFSLIARCTMCMAIASNT